MVKLQLKIYQKEKQSSKKFISPFPQEDNKFKAQQASAEI